MGNLESFIAEETREQWAARQSMIAEAIAARRTYVNAGDLTPGLFIQERTERGTIKTYAAVVAVTNCLTDPGNVHVHVSVNGRQNEWCYMRLAKVEVE
jgi:hypothetical protein